MSRQLFWASLAFIFVGTAFGLVCLLVRISRAHPWLVRRKLALGAVLLSLTWAAGGCSEDGPGGGGGGGGTCYLPLVEMFVFDDPFVAPDSIELDLAGGHVLTGTVTAREAAAYAYRLSLAGGPEVRRGVVVATDGAFDESQERFAVDLGADLVAGEYVLDLFHGVPEAIADGRQGERVVLRVVGAAVAGGTP